MNGASLTQRAQFTDDQLQQLQQVITAAVQPLQTKITELQVELSDVKHQLAHGDERMTELTDGLKQNNDSTEEMRDMFDTAKKGLKFLGTIGAGLKWTAGVVATLSAIYTFWKGWKHP